MQPLKITAMTIIFAAIPSIGFTTQLSLNNFLKQVEEKNQSITASKLNIEAAKLRENESKLIFRPSIFAQAQTAIDKKPTTNRNAQGDQTDYDFVTTGLNQQFNFGLVGKFNYTLSHTHIHNASSSLLPVSEFRDGIATLELSQSLWRNFWGQEAKSQEIIINSQSQAQKHNENFKLKTTLAQAESLYWNLSQARKVAKVQRESLDRALKIKNWNQNRLKSGLAENSDYLQSDANYKAREYELKSTLQDVKNLERSLNSLRGINNDVFDEELEVVNSSKIKELSLPLKSELRDDTKAALELQKLARANADLSIEKNKPTFELYGTYALNGRDPKSSEAINNSFKTDHDTRAIGVRFLAPLDFGTTHDNISGYNKEKIAAEQNFQRKFFDQEEQWNDLVNKFEDAKIRLSLIEKIEEAQKIKASNERDRLNRGRTVTFQVLNFEQDYAQSQLARIQSETNILNIYSQLQIFNGGSNQ